MGTIEFRIERLERERNELLRRIERLEAEASRDASRFASLRLGGLSMVLLTIGGALGWLAG